MIGEPGEFVGMIKKNDAARDFHGYADKEATKKKIVCDVLTKGDAAFKSGDTFVSVCFLTIFFVYWNWRNYNLFMSNSCEIITM